MNVCIAVRNTAAALLAAAALWSQSAAAAPIGVTEVTLDGRRSQIRSVETNLGNLVADAFLWQGRQSGFNPTISFVNAGSVRSENLDFVGATPATPADITDDYPARVFPFGATVAVIDGITVDRLLLALENSVSNPGLAGRFLQVSGFRFSWNASESVGSRIRDVVLDSGTFLIDEGAVVSNLLLSIATSSDILNGLDGYTMLSGGVVQGTGITDDEALASFVGIGLSGRIQARDYPLGGNERIFRDVQLVPEPATLAILGTSLLALVACRRRKDSTREA